VRLDGDPHLSTAGQVIAADALQRALEPELRRLDSAHGL
jgi:hypothetical protein